MNATTKWAIAWTLLSLACSNDPVRPTLDPVVEVRVSAPAPHLWIGQTVTLAAEALNAEGEEIEAGPVTWASLTPSVAGVAADGKLTGLAEGRAIVTATAGGRSGRIELDVHPRPVARVVIDPSTPLVLRVGDTQRLSALALGEDDEVLEGRPVAWSTEAGDAATVDDEGLLTARFVGDVRVRASVEGVWAELQVTVEPVVVPVAAVRVTPAELLLEVGASDVLVARTFAADSTELTGREVTWSTSAEDVVRVAADGTVEAVGGGVAWITAASEGSSAQVRVTVPAWEAHVLTAVGGAPLPAVWRSFPYTDSAGVTLTRTIRVSAGELRVAELTGRYEHELTLELWEQTYVLVDGAPVFWGVQLVDRKTFLDLGSVAPEYLGSGVFVFQSETLAGHRFAGTRSLAGWEVDERINGFGDPVRLTFSRP